MDTVQPYADQIEAGVQALDTITEEAFALAPKRGVKDVVALLHQPDATALCIHRPTNIHFSRIF